MRSVAVFLDNEPSDGGTFQYNQAVVDTLMNLNSNEFKFTLLYTTSFWENYLINSKLFKIRVNYNKKSKKILKGITLLNLNKKLRYLIFKLTFPKISSIFTKNNFDVVIFPSQDTLALFIDKPKINVIHDLMHIYEPKFDEASGFGRKLYRNILFKSFCDESKAIIVDSEVGKTHVHDSYNLSLDNIYSWPYLPPPHILDLVNQPEDFDLKYSKLPNKYLFYPAQFWKHKNHINIIKAVHKLKLVNKIVNVVFAGKMSYEFPILLKTIKELEIENQIHFLGFVPNEYLKEIYIKSTGLIMPTFFGPTNIPPLEAIFLGKPVAVSDIYAMKEQLGDAAIYFDPNQVNSICDSIDLLYFDEKTQNELILNSKKFTEKWNKDSSYKRFEFILKSILD